MDLAKFLPVLLPLATGWAEERNRDVLETGRPLDEGNLSLARTVGVSRPDLIRIAFVETFSPPDNPLLRAAARQTDLLGPDTAGLTLGYAVLIRKGFDSTRLRSHEYRHVRQYEAAGSIRAFLDLYFRQILAFGYEDAPLEVDARRHEVDG